MVTSFGNSFTSGLQEACVDAMELGMRDTALEAYRESSGPYSSAYLAERDHPYAVRHGAPLIPGNTINVQSGDFRAAWQLGRTMIVSGVVSEELRNDSKVADWLQGGTKTMFARPIGDDLEAFADAAIEKYLAQTLKAWQNTRFAA